MTESAQLPDEQGQAGQQADASEQDDFAADLEDAGHLATEPEDVPAQNLPALPSNGTTGNQYPQDLDEVSDPSVLSDGDQRQLRDYHAKRRRDSEATRAAEQRAQQAEVQLARLQGQQEVVASQQEEVDPLATLRSSLSEDEGRALDIVQEINRLTTGDKLNNYDKRFQMVENVVKQLAANVIQNRAQEVNAVAQEARAKYPDIDQYKAQVGALSAVVNPATGQNYTPTEAYELVTGRAQQQSQALHGQHRDTRNANATRPSSPVHASPSDGQLSDNQLLAGMQELGFGTTDYR